MTKKFFNELRNIALANNSHEEDNNTFEYDYSESVLDKILCKVSIAAMIAMIVIQCVR